MVVPWCDDTRDCNSSTMPRGVPIAESTCWTVVRMTSCHFSPEQVKAFTDMSPRQQRQIMKLWLETGQVVKVKDGPNLCGRPQQLSADDVTVSSSYILPQDSIA